MAYQDDAYQTSATAAFQPGFFDDLTLGATADLAVVPTSTITQDLALSASAEFDPGGPSSVSIRLRVFIRRPSRYSSVPTLAPGENETLAEPVLFFNKDAQVNLDFTILNPDGTAHNLTGASVDLLARPERGSTVVFTCSILDAANGKARRTVLANDFADGSYQAQLRVTNGAVIFHTVYFRILVGQALA